MKDTYLKSLQQIPRVTASGADGVHNLYPSMRRLFESYEARDGNKAARDALLVDARVSVYLTL